MHKTRIIAETVSSIGVDNVKPICKRANGTTNSATRLSRQ